MNRLLDKICIVTGGASGLGMSICEKFAEEGAVLAVFDLAEKAGNELVAKLNAAGNSAIFIKGDVTKKEDWDNAVKTVIEKFNRIDVLVNNTGIFKPGDVAATDEEVFKKILDVNVNGVFLGMHAVVGTMEKQGKGSIINVSSEAGIIAIKDQIAYNTSKAAVIMMTKSTAVDFATKGIRANALCPGRMRTALVERILEEAPDYNAEFEKLSYDRPIMRMGKAEEVAMGAVYLASDESLYCTGAVLSIDGAYSCA